MYGFEDRDPEKERKEWQKRLRELVAYLSHVNKDEHLKTAMELIDANARLESNVQTMMDERRDKVSYEYGEDRSAPEEERSAKQVIELPEGTRKVSIEL